MSNPSSPSLPWRLSSSITMGLTGGLCRAFYYGLNNVEVVGLEKFLKNLDRRKDVAGRERGLITVSNHISVMDDPLMWGVLPFKYSFDADNHRWSLGSHDICFQNWALTTFFNFGRVLPCHRKAHSEFGGLFQPVMTQAIRLLSSQPFHKSPSSFNYDVVDPFTSGLMTYTTNGSDSFVSPSYFQSRRHSWLHIFPEGRIHQHPQKSLRYFKWGVSRLILEAEPMPEVIPMFIDGNQEVMHESREFPRFIPRAGKNILVAFGDPLDGEKVFGDLRRRWQQLVKLQKQALVKKGQVEKDWELPIGELTEGLKYNDEAVAIREEVTLRVRNEVLKVRRSLGYPDEDPKNGRAETWIEEGPHRTGRMEDGSWVGDT